MKKDIELKTMILDGLQKCTTPQQELFKRMYPCNTTNATLASYVDAIPTQKLKWANTQIINTLAINETRLHSIIEPTIQQSPVQAPPSTKKKTLTINTRDTNIVRLYTHEVVDENNHIVYEGISYEQCMSYIELEELQR